MGYLTIILIIIFIFSLLLTFLNENSKMTAMQIVNDMGIGINLANSFDCHSPLDDIKNPDDQITLWGNEIITKEMITSIKKNKFKTIRFPVTWKHFIDENNKVNSEWMFRVKEVVDWIVNINNMYCILNVFHDGANGNWLHEGIKAKPKYISLWSQIAEEFKYFDEHLIFESMNDIEYALGDDYDYLTLLSLTQAFVDTVRNSGGNNNYRLLLISGANKEVDLTCSEDYIMPKDPYNKLAISIHYYIPSQYCLELDDNPWTWIDESGEVHIINSKKSWGDEADYNNMISKFETIKSSFIDKGIPVIITEIGVLTEQQKKPESIREYLYAHFSMSADYNGLMSCLWDTSKKSSGIMNFFNREKGEWYDEKIKNNFKKIARGKYAKPTEYFIRTNSISVTEPDPDDFFSISIGQLKVVKVIFNAKISTSELWRCGFGMASLDSKGGWVGETIGGEAGNKGYDGSYTYTFDVSNKDFNDYIQIQKWWGQEFITMNYLTVIFKETQIFLDYKEYKKNLAFYDIN